MTENPLEFMELIFVDQGYIANFSIPEYELNENVGIEKLIKNFEKIERDRPMLNDDELFEKVLEKIPELFEVISTEELSSLIEALVTAM